MRHDNISTDYFAWMYDLVCGGRFAPNISFRKLLTCLHEIEFVPALLRDENRAENGISLRYHFSLSYASIERADEYLRGPCSILEMMIALALKIEETMDDPRMGDRTAQWFWNMIVSLGLGPMNDDWFDEKRVHRVVVDFLNRNYEPDGKGGLFTIRGCQEDMRDLEIWHQMCLYLNTLN